MHEAQWVNMFQCCLVHFAFLQIPENSGAGTVVGTLTTSDPDNGREQWQTFKYALLDNAGGRFMVDGATIKVCDGLVTGALLCTTCQ